MYRIITNPVNTKEELSNIAQIIKSNSSNLSVMKHQGKFMLVEEASVAYYRQKFIDGLDGKQKEETIKSLHLNLSDAKKLIREGATVEGLD